ncbi:MAG: TatD family hydrolase [Elusimicrobiota bacterium]
MLFDTHTHLNDEKFAADRGAVLERARAAGVGALVEIADSPDDWDRAVALARARPALVRCALGLHPYYADRWSEELGRALRAKADLPEVVAAGEIGLDYARCEIPHTVQQESFLKMCAAAAAADLPVIIHCRDADDDNIRLLEDFYGGRKCDGRFRGVLHCFSGAAEHAARAVRLGFALGADGPVTYPKNDALRAALGAAGLENIVLETDSPYLPPQSRRGKRNEPDAVPEIAAKLAEVFGVTTEEVAAQTTHNARDLFRLA